MCIYLKCVLWGMFIVGGIIFFGVMVVNVVEISGDDGLFFGI